MRWNFYSNPQSVQGQKSSNHESVTALKRSEQNYTSKQSQLGSLNFVWNLYYNILDLDFFPFSYPCWENHIMFTFIKLTQVVWFDVCAFFAVVSCFATANND
jgi:hypothetical protein